MSDIIVPSLFPEPVPNRYGPCGWDMGPQSAYIWHCEKAHGGPTAIGQHGVAVKHTGDNCRCCAIDRQADREPV